MKRLFASAALAMLVTALAVPAMAMPAQGTWGLGYFRPAAPIGARMWFSPKVGGDLGFGFTSTSGGAPGAPSTSSYTIDIGVPIVIANAGNASFQFRPGFAYQSDDNGVNKPTEMAISADLAVEYFFTDHFSLQVAHGIAWTSTNPDVPTYDNITGFTSEAFGISNIGFHFYFGKK